MDIKKVMPDHEIIGEIIEPDSKVIDLGCGNGELLSYLVDNKNVRAKGIDLNEEAIYQCVEKGLSVFHGDLESGLREFPTQSYDYVILNQSFQEVTNVEFLFREAFRVGRRVIVGFSNFAYIKARIDLCFLGRAPMDESLPYNWYDTPNVHFLSIKDFKEFAQDQGFQICKACYLGHSRRIYLFPNLLALNAIFVLSKLPGQGESA